MQFRYILPIKDNSILIYENNIYFDSMMFVFTQPLYHGQDVTHGQFFKRNKADLNSEFSFSETGCLTKAKELSLSYYLPIGVWEKNRWIHALPKGNNVK